MTGPTEIKPHDDPVQICEAVAGSDGKLVASSWTGPDGRQSRVHLIAAAPDAGGTALCGSSPWESQPVTPLPCQRCLAEGQRAQLIAATLDPAGVTHSQLERMARDSGGAFAARSWVNQQGKPSRVHIVASEEPELTLCGTAPQADERGGARACLICLAVAHKAGHTAAEGAQALWLQPRTGLRPRPARQSARRPGDTERLQQVLAASDGRLVVRAWRGTLGYSTLVHLVRGDDTSTLCGAQLCDPAITPEEPPCSRCLAAAERERVTPVHAAYAAGKLSLTEAAEQLDTTPEELKQLCERFGLRVRHTLPLSDVLVAHTEYISGRRSNDELADFLGVLPGSLHRIFRYRGLPTLSVQEAPRLREARRKARRDRPAPPSQQH